jgi:hypothetical protein
MREPASLCVSDSCHRSPRAPLVAHLRTVAWKDTTHDTPSVAPAAEEDIGVTRRRPSYEETVTALPRLLGENRRASGSTQPANTYTRVIVSDEVDQTRLTWKGRDGNGWHHAAARCQPLLDESYLRNVRTAGRLVLPDESCARRVIV